MPSAGPPQFQIAQGKPLRNSSPATDGSNPRIALNMTSKTEDIVDSIRSAIMSHRLLPGTQLREVSLGRLYGVSRTVVRQALQQLAKDGLVELTPGKIASVAQPTPKEAREVFDLRMAIEKHALRSLIDRATKKDLAKLRAHLKEERAAFASSDTAAIRALGAGFHVLMARLSGNDLLADLLEHLTARIALILVLYQHDYDRHVECLQDEHQQFIELIESKSLDSALTLMEAHLKVVEVSLKMVDVKPSEDLQLQRALQI
ncbi:MAG: GntR family transcriptional regulator [Polaromonas sp.]